MNEDDLSARLQKVNLTNEKEDNIVITAANKGSALEECSLSLLGRFLTQKPINFRVARSTLRLAWRMGDDVRIVEEWGLTAATTIFTHAFFWVQIWGLPFDLMDPGVGETIGHNLGNFVLVDKRSKFMDSASFLRIRVEIPIAKPLRGGYILSPEGEQCKFVLIPLLQPVTLLHRFYLMESGCVLHQAANQYSSTICVGVSAKVPYTPQSSWCEMTTPLEHHQPRWLTQLKRAWLRDSKFQQIRDWVIR
ncbi:hypothetical protein FCV25MIE_27370 [Fagus crenata]